MSCSPWKPPLNAYENIRAKVAKTSWYTFEQCSDPVDPLEVFQWTLGNAPPHFKNY